MLGLVVFLAGGFVAFGSQPPNSTRFLMGSVIMAVAAALDFPGWRALSKTLLAYGYAARIPVAIVMFFAIQGNWGTHYDALSPLYKGSMEFWPKYAWIGLLPQLIMWVAYTIVVGALFGSGVAAIARREKPAPQPAS